MRGFALLAFCMLALAGCVGSKNDPETPASVTNPPTTPVGQMPKITVLAPLQTQVVLDAPQWVVSGTAVNVSMAPPANAKGAVTYAWALSALPGTVDIPLSTADTGYKTPIEPGSTGQITFKAAGTYLMHCHPHPFMLMNVTVLDGLPAAPADVYIVDDGSADHTGYRFVPSQIVVGVGSVVTYHNAGTLPHTATVSYNQTPPLKLQNLTSNKGQLTINPLAGMSGQGWMNIVGIARDSEGRVSVTNASIYVTPTLPKFTTKTVKMDFNVGTPAQLDGQPVAAAAKTEPLAFELPGNFTINYTVNDPATAASDQVPNQDAAEIHLVKDGETQDTATSSTNPTGSLTGKAVAGAYSLKVIPRTGGAITVTIVVDMQYVYVPPAPAPPPVFDESKPHTHPF